MPRRKKQAQYQHHKFQQVDTDDGWTHVVRGPSIKTANLNPGALTAMGVQKSLRTAYESVDALRAEYEKQKQLLNEDPNCITFLNDFDEQLMKYTNVEASHALCLGLGSMSFQNYRTNSSLKQLVLFENAIEVLKARHRIREPTFVYFQDPEFTPLDTQFLTSFGYQVIPYPWGGTKSTILEVRGPLTTMESSLHKHPLIQLERRDRIASASYITKNTFLYTPYLEWATTGQALVEAAPSLYLGPDIRKAPNNQLMALTEPEEHQAYGKSLEAAIESLDWQTPMTGDDSWWHDFLFGLAKVPQDGVMNAEERDQPSNDIPTWKADKLSQAAGRKTAYREKIAAYRPEVERNPDGENCTDLARIKDVYDDEKRFRDKYGPCLSLIACLEAAVTTNPNLHITEVICIGIGGFTQLPGGWFKQLALLEKAVDFLRSNGRMDAKAPVYLQDPDFRELDVQFVQGMGYDVIPVPPKPHRFTKEDLKELYGDKVEARKYARGQIRAQCTQWQTDNTLLYCPSIPSEIIDDAIRNHPPALYLGSFIDLMPPPGGLFQPSIATLEFERKAAWYAIKPSLFSDGKALGRENAPNSYLLGVRDGRLPGRELGECMVFENVAEKESPAMCLAIKEHSIIDKLEASPTGSSGKPNERNDA